MVHLRAPKKHWNCSACETLHFPRKRGPNPWGGGAADRRPPIIYAAVYTSAYTAIHTARFSWIYSCVIQLCCIAVETAVCTAVCTGRPSPQLGGPQSICGCDESSNLHQISITSDLAGGGKWGVGSPGSATSFPRELHFYRYLCRSNDLRVQPLTAASCPCRPPSWAPQASCEPAG